MDSSSNYSISSEPSRLQLDFIIRSLQTTYWAKHRSEAMIREAVRRSLCFGVYSNSDDTQVGFARVVSDGVTCSWLCDVFIDPAHRGRGLGRAVVAEALRHPAVAGTTFHLGTQDAHGLYEKFGFVRVETMRRPASPIPAAVEISNSRI